MSRMLQCLVWITVMTASGRTQRGYQSFQNQRSIYFPEARNQDYYHRSRHADITNLQEPKIQNRVSELRRTENGFGKQLSKRETELVFPGLMSSSTFEPQISEECKKQGYCDRIANYPTKEVQDLISEISAELRGKFQHDKLDTDNVQIAQRFGLEGSTFGLCSSSEKIIIPDSLPDKNNKWWTLLQDRNNNLTQGFRVEICDNRDGNCSRLLNFPSRSYTNKCDQKFSFRSILIVEDNKAVGQRFLKLPTCCSCMITVHSS